MNHRPLLGLLAALVAVACGEDESPDPQNLGMTPDAGFPDAGFNAGFPDAGMVTPSDMYYVGAASAGLGAQGNQADCALCHSRDGTQEGFAGNTLQNIAYRMSFKGSPSVDLLGGANACITGWMGGTALTPTSPEWLSLLAFLQSISDPTVTAPNTIAPEVLADQAAYEAAYAGGDATAGEAKYATYCGDNCHASQLVVGDRQAWIIQAMAALPIGRIAQVVRTSGPPPSGTSDATDLTSGPMPFFEPSDLSVEDLRDIIAFIKQ